MADLARFKVPITWGDGGPGLNVWTFSPGSTSWNAATIDDLQEEIGGFYDAINDYMAGDSMRRVISQAEIFDSESGDITNIVAGTNSDYLIGNPDGDSQPFNGVSICANLNTGVWHDGRQLRGRHFLGPVAFATYSVHGELVSGAVDDVKDAYAAMISGLGPNLAVWHRPTGGLGTGGYYEDVGSVAVKTGVSYLRSRVG
jgi:hypothetical protein